MCTATLVNDIEEYLARPISADGSPTILRTNCRVARSMLANGGVLEFAIGTGRAPSAPRGAVKVSGIYIAPAMVAQLRNKVDAAPIPVIVGDMSKAQFPATTPSSTCVQRHLQPPDASRAGRVLSQRRAPPQPRRTFRPRAGVPTIPHPADPPAVVDQSTLATCWSIPSIPSRSTSSRTTFALGTTRRHSSSGRRIATSGRPTRSHG